MKPIGSALLVILALSTVAFIAIRDVIKDLGIKHSNAQSYILKNLVGNFDATPIGSDPVEDVGGSSLDAQLKSFKVPYIRNLRSMVAGDKATVAKDVCQYVKEYINSDEFAESYAALRAKTKPVSEPPRLSAVEVQNIEKSLIQGEKALAQAAGYMTKQQLAEAKKAIAEQKLQIQQQKDPTPNKTQWEKMYPADPSIMVKKRLQEYLVLAATVDFKAETTGSGSSRTFTNPAYEAKPVKWKVIYRAGKEVNDVVTGFVKQWLAGEIIAREKTSMAQYKDVDVSSAKGNGSAGGNKQQERDDDSGDNESIVAGKAKEVKTLFKKVKQKIVE
ncbi:hypothetical protein U0035_18970 [Niabella yanshanensis]|uniref:PpiC domain-containing protein n=1 Tax=Niabella yanshanensis TaxID=577386 RepID=A0ABZ0W539_9BACT|nr:hypothetical protein [Niabella yanshanensis]WQD37753.1 hypothetical protein U0035_18970 [Niabella yanshanensis]